MRDWITAADMRMEISPVENYSNFERAFVCKKVPPHTMGHHVLAFANSANNVNDQRKSMLIIIALKLRLCRLQSFCQTYLNSCFVSTRI